MHNTTIEEDGHGHGHADDIFGTATYEAPEREKKIFEPWHKPRKQFVRHHQWCTQIKLLLDDMQPDDNTLKYLGLPGNDLLDLRHFHTHVCEPRQMRLRFLGFNRGAKPGCESQTDSSVSLDEVLKLSKIHPLSEVIWDDFCLIADENSKAWNKTKDSGPYDIINLDLCDGFGAHEPGTLDNTHYNAVNRLMSLQAKNKRPWLLFLTTRSDNKNVNADVLQRLLGKYVQNLAECAPFKDASAQIFSIGDEAELMKAVGTPDGHLAVFLVGICKWLLGIAVQHPPSKVEVKSVIGYRVDAEALHDDLISLAIRFEPTFAPATDPLGLANAPVARLSECSLSAKAVKRLGRRKCADEILAEDVNLLNEMIASTASLLELARYDVRAYYKWLQAN